LVNERHEPILGSGMTVGPFGKDLGYALTLGGIGVMGHSNSWDPSPPRQARM